MWKLTSKWTILKKGLVYDTWCSQAVTHLSTNHARRCLTSVIGRELVFSTWYGRRRTSSALNAFEAIDLKLCFATRRKWNRAELSETDKNTCSAQHRINHTKPHTLSSNVAKTNVQIESREYTIHSKHGALRFTKWPPKTLQQFAKLLSRQNFPCIGRESNPGHPRGRRVFYH